jgi:hypothetical protein
LRKISSKEEKQPEMSLPAFGGLVIRERGRRLKRGSSKYKIEGSIKRTNMLPGSFVIKFLADSKSALFFLLSRSKTQLLYYNDVISSFFFSLLAVSLILFRLKTKRNRILQISTNEKKLPLTCLGKEITFACHN